MAAEANNHKTILIVDDSKTIRAILKDFLKDQPYRLLEASNGVEALNEMNDAAVNLVITDIMMPEMNGFKLLENIKEKHKGVDVIAMSGVGGRSTADSVLRGLNRLGVRNTLTKPFSKAELLRLVSRVIE